MAAQPGGEIVGQQLLDRHVAAARIADEGIALGIGEALGLHLQMQPFCADRVEGGEIEALQDIEHDLRRDAAAVGRDFEHGPAAIAGFERRDRLVALSCKILLRVAAAGGVSAASIASSTGPA